MSENGAVGPPGEHASDANGTGPRTAGEGDPRPALPRAHPDLAWAHHLNDVHIDTPGKRRMPFQFWAERFQRKVTHTGYKEHRVRVAHRNRGDGQRAIVNLDRGIDGWVARQKRRNPLRVKDGRAHV